MGKRKNWSKTTAEAKRRENGFDRMNRMNRIRNGTAG